MQAWALLFNLFIPINLLLQINRIAFVCVYVVVKYITISSLFICVDFYFLLWLVVCITLIVIDIKQFVLFMFMDKLDARNADLLLLLFIRRALLVHYFENCREFFMFLFVISIAYTIKFRSGLKQSVAN